ncbi:hypothetical protein SAMN05216266_103255 [Amycolatopsis marina]|uniref:Secreted protein n=1 Tax=Amycolatopsis marina TaxID=490629 RepID=A0A1I0XJ32_9PSEU|nr:hypothetical protein SAMN05216266_103255 [Amycolatopsis marina]
MFTRRTRHGFALAGLTLGAMVVLAPAASAASQPSSVGLEDVVTSSAGALTGSVGALLGGVDGGPGITEAVPTPSHTFNEILPKGILGG